MQHIIGDHFYQVKKLRYNNLNYKYYPLNED